MLNQNCDQWTCASLRVQTALPHEFRHTRCCCSDANHFKREFALLSLSICSDVAAILAINLRFVRSSCVKFTIDTLYDSHIELEITGYGTYCFSVLSDSLRRNRNVVCQFLAKLLQLLSRYFFVQLLQPKQLVTIATV